MKTLPKMRTRGSIPGIPHPINAHADAVFEPDQLRLRIDGGLSLRHITADLVEGLNPLGTSR